MIAMRVIIGWLFVNSAQSVFVAVLFRTMSNMPYGLVSNHGSHCCPFVTFLILAIIVAAIFVTRPKQNSTSVRKA